MPKIGIDCRFASSPHGLGRYTREIVAHLLKRDDPFDYVLFVSPDALPWARSLPGSPTIVPFLAAHYSMSEHWVLPRKLRAAGIDLLFSTHFNVPLRCPVPFVVTIHDLILHRFPNSASFLKQRAYRLLMRHAVLRARGLIAVSRFTASEIGETYGSAAAKKVTVIGEGVDSSFRSRTREEQDAVLSRYQLTRPFFLYAGNAKEHKNVQMLIDAFAQAAIPGATLALASRGKETNTLNMKENVRLLPNVADEDLPALYSAAAAFVTASLYEGFGLPIAEAGACGCPVIATNRGSIPEVAPPGSVLLEPTVEAFAEALRHPPTPQETSSRWRWDTAAEETVNVLKQALGL